MEAQRSLTEKGWKSQEATSIIRLEACYLVLDATVPYPKL